MRKLVMKMRPWPLFISAPLLGLSHSILLVFTPIFIEKTTLSLASLAILMSLGSALFLFSAPMWAKCSLRYGYPKVLLSGILGFSTSFSLMLVALWGSVSLQWPMMWVISCLIISRVIYGMTASAIVPSCQAWLSELNHAEHTMKKLAELSATMAFGRLIAPLLAMALIWIGWQAPLLFLSLAPLICLGCILKFSHSQEPLPTPAAHQIDKPISVQNKIEGKFTHSLLISITLICISYSCITFLLTPMAIQWLNYSNQQASQYLSLLMTLAAMTMLLCHGITSKLKQVDQFKMMLLANMMLLLSLILMQLPIPHILFICVPLLSGAFAILQLQITSLLCNQAGKGRKAIATGLVSKYQTLGYGIGAGLLWLTNSDIDTNLQLLTLLGLAQLASLMFWKFNIGTGEAVKD
ncbi:MFS transporter [Shewanella woodyi]|uniref:MFS transporter n=1 Tax=Shewanella woodyi TaxID=60961 RepID=UPI0012FB8BDE|nr:MFS transporter [Shewanella woodyi]